jgi:Family of unknown function (DUF6361)
MSNALFPGTSTLHRRLRYVLFVPWLLQQAARKDSPDEMRGELRTRETKLALRKRRCSGGLVSLIGVGGASVRW